MEDGGVKAGLELTQIFAVSYGFVLLGVADWAEIELGPISFMREPAAATQIHQ